MLRDLPCFPRELGFVYAPPLPFVPCSCPSSSIPLLYLKPPNGRTSVGRCRETGICHLSQEPSFFMLQLTSKAYAPGEKVSFPLSQVYRLLEPGPVVMVTTASKGRANIMTMSWHMMIDFEPPIVGCVISDRNYTFNILKATKECVINIPTVELAKRSWAAGTPPDERSTSSRPFVLRRRPPPASRRRSSTNAMPISNARSSMRGWRPNTTSLSLRCSKRGSTPQGKTRGRFIISGEAPSWLPARRSSCPPK